MDKKKAVLFDLDGTLIDSSEGITKSAQYALQHYGMEETDIGKLRRFIGPPLSGSFMKYYGFSKEQALEAVGIYRERYNVTGIFECELYPGVIVCLNRLREMGYAIGVASSKPEISCRRILEHFGILELFDDVAGSTMDGSIETKEQVLGEVFRRWPQIPKHQIVLVGDTIFDVEGANKAGIKSIAVGYGFGDAGQMLAAGAKAVCYDMFVVPEVIANVGQDSD